MRKYIVVVLKGSSYVICRMCSDENCDEYHFYSNAEDSFVASEICKALNRDNH